MRITKKGLRSLVKEMIKVEKGLVTESKVVKNNPLRKMIREELMKESPETEAAKKMMKIVQARAAKLGGNIIKKGEAIIPKNNVQKIIIQGYDDVQYTQSKSSRIQLAAANTPEERVGSKTLQIIDMILGSGIVVYKGNNNEIMYLVSSRPSIMKAGNSYGLGGKISQTLKITIPQGISLVIDGKEITQ